MSVSYINVGNSSADNNEELKLSPADCGLGHSCQFCPHETHCSLDKPHHEKVLIESRLERIDQIILVMANKGGVGKSTVSANLASGIAQRGYRVGVADADVHGPNQSRFFGFAGKHVRLSDQGLGTKDFSSDELVHPVKVGSLAFLMESDDTPIVWRDAYKHDFMHHLIGSFDWGELDFLIIDMPPGTGNELITLADMLEGANVSALLATTPQDVALMDSMKAVRFCRERGLPMLGVVENMSGITCPHCSGKFHLFPREHLAESLTKAGVESLTQIPLALELAAGSDKGMPVVLAHPQSLAAQAFIPIVDACEEKAHAEFSQAAVRSLDDAFEKNLESSGLEEALAGFPEEEREAMRQDLEAMLSAEQGRLSGGGDRNQ